MLYSFINLTFFNSLTFEQQRLWVKTVAANTMRPSILQAVIYHKQSFVIWFGTDEGCNIISIQATTFAEAQKMAGAEIKRRQSNIGS